MPRVTLALALAATLVYASIAGAATDQLHAVNVVPPGESGSTNLMNFTAVTAGLSTSYGPHTDDQAGLYANWQYKPMQFYGEGQGAAAPGDANVKIVRDTQYGVPTITGVTDDDVYYGIGYAMAQDRLAQMEVLRHVGHGTLASLIGPSGLAMDEQIRRVTEGPAALQAEFDALPAAEQQRLTRFGDGVNAFITEAQMNPNVLPAEFMLLNDLPIKPWTVGDSLAFGEYAGRFFGEFGHGELGAQATYAHLVAKFGARKAESLYRDLVPLQDAKAPTSIAKRDGAFPRHSSKPVKTSFKGSRYANHDPKLLPAPVAASRVATAVDNRQSLVRTLQRLLALPRFGSNAVIVAPKRSADGKAMLYGGPQTGWADPGFFWEAELHSPDRDQRGVFVPAVPVMVIGRTNDTAWTVTSALDANSDTFVEKLCGDDSTYVHNGKRLTAQKHVQTIACNNPPTEALSLLNGALPTTCPSAPVKLTVYRTVHGPALADPGPDHKLYVRQSVVDGRLMQSFAAWDAAGLQHDVKHFGAALKGMALGFNFFYADVHNHIAYWHTGAYPIRPRNADPSLPVPGDGRYDWKGLESWSAHPHVVDPRSGYLVNWNNKPSTGWWSKNLETGGEGGFWGDEWESVPLAHVVAGHSKMTFDQLGQVPREVAYTDNRARVGLPYLRRALTHTTDASLVALKPAVDAWNGERNVVNGKGGYGTPAVAFFDRFWENLMRDVEQPRLGDDWSENAGLDCPTCHLRSIDNLSVPTYKFETVGAQLLIASLRGQTGKRWIHGRSTGVALRAALDTVDQLTKEQGTDPLAWNEPVETGEYSAQGALSAPALSPLPNRGSYGQVVEAG